jgi:membrane-associated phospholipid phosphatase
MDDEREGFTVAQSLQPGADSAPDRETLRLGAARQMGTSTSHSELEDDASFWTRRQVAVAALLWLAGAILLALLSVAAHAHAAFPGDVGLEEAVQRLRNTPLDPLLTFASTANWPTPAGIIAIAVILTLALLRHVRAAICAAVAGFGADAANVILNSIVARPRPNNVAIHVVAHLGLHSFPSGHVTHVIGFYGFLLYLTFRVERAHPNLGGPLWVVRAICIYFLVAIGPSRVLSGEHWPSDVLGGYLLGALVLTVSVALYHALAFAWLHLREQRFSHALM